jgi:hypothetical protein
MDMTYSAQPKGFIIYLPKSSAPSQSHMRSFFAGTLINCFETKPNSSSSALASKNADSAAAADDWADVSVDNKTGKAAIIDLPSRGPTTRHENRQHQQYRHQQEAPEYDTIPDISTLSRPDELLRRPPYHLVVHAVGRTRVEVQCSHSPTLQFLSDYLKKWSRTNHNHTTKVSFSLSSPPLFNTTTQLPKFPYFSFSFLAESSSHIQSST